MLLTVPYPACPHSLCPADPAPMTALSPNIRQPWHYPLPCWPTPGLQWAAQHLLVTIFPSSSPGDIGGQMGLFIGASILTILEILDYIYEVCLAFRNVSWQWVQRQATWGEHKMCGHPREL